MAVRRAPLTLPSIQPALERIHKVLQEYRLPDASEPLFLKVFGGHYREYTVSAGRPIAQWMYARSFPRPEGARSLNGVQRGMAIRAFVISVMWPIAGEERAIIAQESQIVAVSEDLPNAFVDDFLANQSAWGADVNRVTFEPGSSVAEVRYDEFAANETPWRIFAFNLDVGYSE